jgi:2,3-bisphosphoglycerate-independent phosphoglycerate mutase
VAFPKEVLKNVIGEVISNEGLKQYRTAETEKYAHVTYFLNGGEEKVFEGEERGLINSPKVATYDLKPEMSAHEVTENLINIFETRDDIGFFVINYANCDMVGHTGIMEAAVKAVEAVDRCLEKLVKSFFENGGKYVIVTADHGNAEQMIDYESKKPFTEHTLNQVPLVLIGDNNLKLCEEGALCDIAPTILQLMKIDQPDEMTGKSLII